MTENAAVYQELKIRSAQPEDLSAVYALMADFEMFGKFSSKDCFVAEINKRLIGFIRVELAGEKPYLRPIVVARKDQGQGVGKALIDHILKQWTELRIIARGNVVPFYKKIGFKLLEWEEIPSLFREECLACPDLGTCNPVPMLIEAN